ncbi:MAG: hypothetical protein IPO41_17590 [Acidobacteria bacterium]|nr:hypothetical protein [Acidobacteriota bacterium]
MFEDNPKRKQIVYKLSFLPVALFFIWGAVGFYTFSSAPHFPEKSTGKTYGISYKSMDRYLTRTQYYLFVGLPLAGFLSIPLMIALTSPKLGLIKYSAPD